MLILSLKWHVPSMVYHIFHFEILADGFVNLARINACGIYIASKFFCANKASALHRHFAHSVQIC